MGLLAILKMRIKQLWNYLKSANKNSYFDYLRDKFYNFFRNRQIFLKPLGNVIYMIPPYSNIDDELNIVYTVISSLLDDEL